MTVQINGTTGIDQIQPGVVQQSDLGSNVAGNGPAFIAVGTTSSIVFVDNASTQLVNIAEISDTHGCYNPVTGEFTPSVPGWYQLNAAIQIGNAFTCAYASIQLVGPTHTTFGPVVVGSSEYSYGTGSVSGLFYFNGSSDRAIIKLSHDSAGNKTGSVSAQFSGFLARAA